MPSALDVIQSIASNPLVTILGVTVGILSVILAVVALRKIRSKQPCYRMYTNNIVTDFTSKVKSLQILKDNKPISDLTTTKIFFWNKGSEPIRANDIAPADILRVECKEGIEILESSLITSNSKASRFSIIPLDNRTLELKFDFLQKDQGAVFQVVYSGKSEDDIGVKGEIIGADKIEKIIPSNFDEYPKVET